MGIRFKKNGEPRKTKHQWILVDWSQPTEIIAGQIGACQQMVSRARKKYAPDTIKKTHIKKTAMIERWKSIDCNKSDSEIAQETGRSRASVWTTRKRMSLLS